MIVIAHPCCKGYMTYTHQDALYSEYHFEYHFAQRSPQKLQITSTVDVGGTYFAYSHSIGL
jgi:hypothetical protein